MNINKELLNDLYDSSIRIDNLFNMELVTACDSLPSSFCELFEYDSAEILTALNLINKNIDEYNFKRKDEVLEFLHDCRLAGFLIQFSTPVPRDFLFTSNGEFESCFSGWNIFTRQYVFAHTLEDALRQALEAQEAYFSECEKKARKELEQQ